MFGCGFCVFSGRAWLVWYVPLVHLAVWRQLHGSWAQSQPLTLGACSSSRLQLRLQFYSSLCLYLGGFCSRLGAQPLCLGVVIAVQAVEPDIALCVLQYRASVAFSRAHDCSKLRTHIIFWVALTPFSWHSGLLWVTLCGLLCKACFSLLPQLVHPLQPRLSPILVPLAVAVARHTAGHFGSLCRVLAYLWWCALGLRGLWSGWLPGLLWCLLLPLL